MRVNRYKGIGNAYMLLGENEYVLEDYQQALGYLPDEACEYENILQLIEELN